MRKSDFFQLISWLLIGLTAGLISSCGKSSDLASKSKTNTPPVITAVNILPEKPTQGSELSLSIQSQDPDGDPVTYSFQWMNNDEEIIGETKNSFSGKTFKKGDLIGVKVTPSDGTVNGKPFLSPQIKVLNSPPVIQEVRIE